VIAAGRFDLNRTFVDSSRFVIAKFRNGANITTSVCLLFRPLYLYQRRQKRALKPNAGLRFRRLVIK
jgi:hypothetical protein